MTLLQFKQPRLATTSFIKENIICIHHRLDVFQRVLLNITGHSFKWWLREKNWCIYIICSVGGWQLHLWFL